MNAKIRKVESQDIVHLKPILDKTELFPSEMLDKMIEPYFQDNTCPDLWFAMTHDDVPISLGYCAPEQMTEGTYNLYAIAVDPASQGQGVGSKMMTYIEELLREKGAHLLLVETSGSADYERTRAFYDKCGYTREATIRDFYQQGEDKVIFWKSLN